MEDSVFTCPVCRSRLQAQGNTLRCPAGHTFDKARQGYVNLLMAQGHGKRHGDDRLMVQARQQFLDKGYYAPLRQALCDLLGSGHRVLDAGCGEGYYTASMAEGNQVCGIDISKDALKYAARRCPQAAFAVASIAAIPLASRSVDTVVSIFAPDSPSEFSRVLAPGGRLIRAVPMEDHLMELKAAVYDKPYRNPPPDTARAGFFLRNSRRVSYCITLNEPEDIRALFKMTPYYYKTSRTDQQKLEALTTLTVGLDFLVTEHIIL